MFVGHVGYSIKEDDPMDGYLCEGGTESCGGQICLSMLEEQRVTLEEQRRREARSESSAKENAIRILANAAVSAPQPYTPQVQSFNSEAEERATQNFIANYAIGQTRQECMATQRGLQVGAARAEQVTIATCALAGAQGFANPATNAGCAIGLGTSILAESGAQALKSYCPTLPTEKPSK